MPWTMKQEHVLIPDADGERVVTAVLVVVGERPEDLADVDAEAPAAE